MITIRIMLCWLAGFGCYAQSWGPLLNQQQLAQRKFDSTATIMFTSLMTDNYAVMPGNLTEVLAVGTRKYVYNSTLNLPETWVGTELGNRLVSMRGSTHSATLSTGQQVIAIPHGLGYKPSVFSATVMSPAGSTPVLSATSVYLVLTFASIPIGTTQYTVNWLVR